MKMGKRYWGNIISPFSLVSGTHAYQDVAGLKKRKDFKVLNYYGYDYRKAFRK